MKKHEYFKKALRRNLADDLAWVTSIICLVKEGPDAFKDYPYQYRLISAGTKYQFLNEKGEVEEIEDSSTKEPLFRFLDEIIVEPKDGFVNVTKPIKTRIGNMIFNSVALLPAFDKYFPFPEGELSISKFEKYVADRLESDPDTEAEAAKIQAAGRFTVAQYLVFRDALVYIESFAQFTSWSATRKGITRPTGIEAYKKQLIQEYGGVPTDPTLFAEFEAKLLAFDKEYLKDDPAFGKFLKGKVLGVSRKKGFLAIGMPDRLDVKEKPVPIVRTLEEGQPTDPKEFAAILNGARFGSYSRGTETINGGVVSKTIIRVASNYEVVPDDCGSKFGMRKVFNKDNIGMLVGRVIVQNGKSVLVEKIEDANNYLGKPVVVRSPAYCRSGAPGSDKKPSEDKLCKVCAGSALSQYPNGLAIPGTEVSHLILNQSLKAMHGKNLTTAVVDLETALT